MTICWPTPVFKGRTFKLCVLIRWDFNFYVCSSPLWGGGGVEREQPTAVDAGRNKRHNPLWLVQSKQERTHCDWCSQDKTQNPLWLVQTRENPLWLVQSKQETEPIVIGAVKTRHRTHCDWCTQDKTQNSLWLVQTRDRILCDWCSQDETEPTMIGALKTRHRTHCDWCRQETEPSVIGAVKTRQNPLWLVHTRQETETTVTVVGWCESRKMFVPLPSDDHIYQVKVNPTFSKQEKLVSHVEKERKVGWK